MFVIHTQLRVICSSLYFTGARLSVDRTDLESCPCASVFYTGAATMPHGTVDHLDQLGAGTPLAPVLTSPTHVLREHSAAGESHCSARGHVAVRGGQRGQAQHEGRHHQGARLPAVPADGGAGRVMSHESSVGLV